MATSTPVRLGLIRTGRRSDLFGRLHLEGVGLQHISLDGRVVCRNAHPKARFSEDDLAVADLLTAAGAWRRGEGPELYPLAGACADHKISLASGELIAAGQPVTTSVEGWSTQGALAEFPALRQAQGTGDAAAVQGTGDAAAVQGMGDAAAVQGMGDALAGVQGTGSVVARVQGSGYEVMAR